MTSAGTTNPAWGFIQTTNISDAQITAPKLATDSVTEDKIVDASVSNAKLTTNSVDTNNIKNHAVTIQKITHPDTANHVLLT